MWNTSATSMKHPFSINALEKEEEWLIFAY